MLVYFIGTVIMAILVHGLFAPVYAWSLSAALVILFVIVFFMSLAKDEPDYDDDYSGENL